MKWSTNTSMKYLEKDLMDSRHMRDFQSGKTKSLVWAFPTSSWKHESALDCGLEVQEVIRPLKGIRVRLVGDTNATVREERNNTEYPVSTVRLEVNMSLLDVKGMLPATLLVVSQTNEVIAFHSGWGYFLKEPHRRVFVFID